MVRFIVVLLLSLSLAAPAAPFSAARTAISNAIRNGAPMDLSDPNHQAALYLHVHAIFRNARKGESEEELNEYGRTQTLERILRIEKAMQAEPVRPKLLWNVSIFSPKILRPFTTYEAPFRGVWGWDCSSETRLLRALEPAHAYFCMESQNHSAIGQTEVVLGKLYDNTKAGFLERFQARANLSVLDIAIYLFSIEQSLAEQRYALVMPRELLDYRRVGHPISNLKGIEERLEAALEYFDRTPTGLSFTRDPDEYLCSESPYKFCFVANDYKGGVHRLSPKRTLYELAKERGWRSLGPPLPEKFDFARAIDGLNGCEQELVDAFRTTQPRTSWRTSG